jgi:hypothetical protein
MSGYPSLLAPLMNTSGLILTSALNTDAQTALALSATNAADIVVLQDTSLQTSAGTYTGLPGAGLVLRDASVNTVLNIDGTYGDVGALGVISGAGFANTNSSFQVNDLGNCTVNELTYTTLNPPIVPSATPSLSEVLTVGNDASQLDITNLNSLAVDTITLPATSTTTTIDQNGLTTQSSIQATNPSGTSLSKSNIFEVYSDNGSTRTAIITADGNVSCQNYYLYGVQPSDFAITNNKNILTTGNITANQINGVVPQFKPTYDYYVAKGGNDTTGLGTILSPYLTVQKAIQVCETAYDGTPRVIHLSSGTYSENITISKPRISIIGEGASMNPDTGSSISGNTFIYLTDGNSDLNNNNIYFSGLLLSGQVLDQTFGIVHRVIITNCYLYATNDCLTVNTAFTLDYRVIINNCTISNSSSSATDPLMLFKGAGMISITNSKITSKGNSQKTVNIADNVRVDTIAQNILTSDGTGNNVAVSIFHHQSSTTITLGQNAFVYSSAGTKRNIDGASAISMTESGSLVALNNIMSLTGLPTGQMAIYNTGSGVVLFGNNISTSSLLGTTATGISGTLNVNKFAGTAVQ